MRIARPRALAPTAVPSGSFAVLTTVLLVVLAAMPLAAAPPDGAEALGRMLSHEMVLTRDGEAVVRIVQEVEVDGCHAVVTLTHYAPGTGRRRMMERSRFEIDRMSRAEEDGEADAGGGSIDLTARDYFVRGRDGGLSRWLAALAATRDSEDRAADMRALQFRIERGEFGAFASRNGYEMRSFLEKDPEPYYSMPLPVVSLTLPEDAADEAADAWWRYAAGHCPG